MSTSPTPWNCSTGAPPVRVDSRHFATGGTGRGDPAREPVTPAGPRAAAGLRARRRPALRDPAAPPACPRRLPAAPGEPRRGDPRRRSRRLADRHREEPHRRTLPAGRHRPDGDRGAVAALPAGRRPTCSSASAGDTWARPVVGTGGNDTFHVDTPARLERAAAYYEERGTDWLLSRDAGNVTADGLRHQFRVFVLGDRVVHAREHLQPATDTPCNTCQGATAVHLAPPDLPPRLAELAVAATASVGLPFAGVDLAAENGGVVFEVNVQPAFVDGERELHAVAVPYVQAHLDALAPGPRRPAPGAHSLSVNQVVLPSSVGRTPQPAARAPDQDQTAARLLVLDRRARLGQLRAAVARPRP